MPTLAVLPVKGFVAAKARLAARLEPAQRSELAEAMLGDVLDALAGARAIEAVVVVTAEPRAEAVARAANAIVVADPAQAGQSSAALLGIAETRRGGGDRVLLVPGDTPLLRAEDVDGLLTRGTRPTPGVVIVPDRHGTGTNALVLSPPDALAPSFGPDSCARHISEAERAGIASSLERVPSLGHDVDTPEDLDALVVRLRDVDPGIASRTRVTSAVSAATEV